MHAKSSAILARTIPVPGLGWAALGVLAFSGTFPATVLALRGLDAEVVGAGRSVIGAMLAVACLVARPAPLPHRAQWPGLLLVAGGCGIGFGVLSAVALGQVTASHAAVIIGLLPLATAGCAVVRNGERVSAGFWIAGGAGALAVAAFAMSEGAGSVRAADAILVIALVVGAVGYAEGGRLAREMPGWRVIAWGLVLALPVSVPIAVAALLRGPLHADASSLAGLGYVSAVSVFLGFFAWYHGLAQAGVARASQVQLAQPFLTVAWSALLLGERPGPLTAVTGVVVLVCVAGSQRARYSSIVRPHAGGQTGGQTNMRSARDRGA